MNGISLLLLLSSLTATAGFERGSNGQSVYTIRIESLLVEEMRNGQSIPVVVQARDRNIRQFKIAVTPTGTRTGAASRYSQPSVGAGDSYGYEPIENANGEIEYLVQISPERLQLLADGTPIEGEVSPEIPQVHRFLIFVGVNQLPSQQQKTATPAYSPRLLANNDNLVPAGAEVRTSDPQSRITAPALNSTQFQPNTTSSSRANDALAQFNSRNNDLRNWRNGPDQSTVAPPPLMTTTQPNVGHSNSTGTAVPAATGNYVNQPAYNNQYPGPYTDPNNGYVTQNGTGYQQPPYNSATGYQQPPIATVAARPDAPPLNAPNMTGQPQQQPISAPAPGGWTPTVVNNQPVATQQPTAQVAQAAAPVAAPTVVAAPAAAEQPKSSWPLVLTSLALFASIGFNLWLGWLAWSFFWRYREAVTESARVRSQVSSRQAA